MRRLLILAVAALGASALASAAEQNLARRQPSSEERAPRIIVKYRPTRALSQVQATAAAESRNQALMRRMGLRLQRTREIAPDMQALDIDAVAARESIESMVARLRNDPDVEFAEVDQRRYAHAIPNDAMHDGQWYLKDVEPSAIEAQTAWDTTTGSKGVVVAVLDTGVRYNHPDLKRASEAGRLLPGYDFVSPESGGTFRTANDGSGRDGDPSDPGDWITSADKATPLFSGCDVSDSSWHGTRVSGIIGALSNNSAGVAGIDWKTWILPVRVLGKCGGFDSDVIPAMRWAAGLHVAGVPDNPYPARVLNMSLGSTTSCPASYQSVINELTNLGVLVVVSAGNEGGPVDAPANCSGAVGVAGLRHVGTKVGFSSLGPQIALSAPGGNCGSQAGNCIYSLDTTTNGGATAPGTSTYTDEVNYNVGTSFSAPIVSGISALMISVNGNLGATQLRGRLRASARPFPHIVTTADCHVPTGPADVQDSECNCTTSTCGAGMANARTAVEDALRPIAAVVVPASVSAGQDVTLEAGGRGGACEHSIASYAWTIVDPGANPPAIAGADTATATVTAPATDPFVVRVTVTDDAGRTDTADITVSPTAAITSAPAAAGDQACLTDIVIEQTPSTEPPPTQPPTTPSNDGGGGGGGAIDLLLLFLLASVLIGGRAVQLRQRALPTRP
jgi:serine protease